MAARLLTCQVCDEWFVAARSDKRTCSPRCRQRLSRNNQPAVTHEDTYENHVWDARRRGLIQPDEALLLLVAPPPGVLKRLQAVAA